ncbi:MAG TPA: hypothetical protein VGE74_28850 [Gemmata sp.]
MRSTFSTSHLALLLTAPLVLAFASSARAVETDVVRGLVVKADAGAKQVTVRPAAGPDVVLTVTDASRIMVGAKDATVRDIKQGQRVRATYTLRAGKKEVVSLRPSATTSAELHSKVKKTLAAAKTYTFQQKDKYAADLREVGHTLDDRIDHLEAEAKDAKADAKQKLQAEIDDLKKQRGALNDRLMTVQSATADTWDDVKSGVSKAASDLEKWLNDHLNG